MAVVAKRLWLTADGQHLVKDGDPRGASLYAAPGDEIAEDDVNRIQRWTPAEAALLKQARLEAAIAAAKPAPDPAPKPEPSPEPKKADTPAKKTGVPKRKPEQEN